MRRNDLIYFCFRSNDDGREGSDDDDESDESLGRRLGFFPLNTETINIIHCLRTLTNKISFDRRDFEIL